MEKRKHRVSSSAPVVVQSTQRGRVSMGPGMNKSVRTNVMSSQSMMPMRAPGELAAMSKKSVDSVKQVRDKEKHAISGLNLKLADYMEKMKFLEGQNQQLRMELDKWKAMKMFDDTKIKEIHTEELDELRDEIKRLNQENSKLQSECLTFKEKYDDLREDMDKLRKQLDDEEAKKEKMIRANEALEIDNLKLANNNTLLTDEKNRLKDEVKTLKEDLERARMDLQAAREDQLNSANELLACQKELEFELDCKDQEIEEYKKLIKQLQSIEPDYSKMWEGQFQQSLMKLQAECDDRINNHMAEVTRNYELKIAQMQASMPRDNTDSVKKVETKTLKSEIGNLNSKLNDLERDNASLKAQLDALRKQQIKDNEDCECEKDELKRQLNEERADKQDVEAQLTDLYNTNISLQEEINVYSALMNTGMGDMMASQGNYQTYGGSMVSQAVLGGGGGGGRGSSSGAGGSGGGSSSQSSIDTRFTMSESTGTLRVKRQSSCAISIVEISQDGRYVKISNGSSSKDFDLGEWTLERKHPKGVSTFTFPKGFKLKPSNQLQIWSSRFEDDAGPGDLAAEGNSCKTWGTGNGDLCLKNRNGETKASSSMAYELK